MQPPADFGNLAMTPEELRSQLPTMPSFITVVERVYDAAPPTRADTPPPPPPVGGMPFINYTHETFSGGQGAQPNSRLRTTAGVESQWTVVEDGSVEQEGHEGGPRADLAHGAGKKSVLPIFAPDGVIPFAAAPMPSGDHAVAGSQEGGHGQREWTRD